MRRRGTGGYQTRSIGAPLAHAYPVSRGGTFRPSGNPDKDPPEVEKEDYYALPDHLSSKTRAEQAEQDRRIHHADVSDQPWGQHYIYWDNIRFGRLEAEARAKAKPAKTRRPSRKIKKAMELLK